MQRKFQDTLKKIFKKDITYTYRVVYEKTHQCTQDARVSELQGNLFIKAEPK